MPEPLFQALLTFQQSNVLKLAVPFVLFTGLLVVARGPRALRLSDETLRSVLLTMTLLVVNGLLAGYLVLRIDLAGGGFDTIGLPHLDAGPWLALPWPITIVLVVLLFDFADYWTHRLMHNSLLWGVHAVHHSDQRLTWLTSSRVHIFESSIMKLGYLFILGWIGFPMWSLLAANVVAYLHNRYVHCNVDWNHGPLAKVIASPNWHRWHHSVEPSAYNKNYANVFSFLDVIFGTYHNPGPCRTAVGLREIPNPTVANQLLLPFNHVWTELRGSRLQAGADTEQGRLGRQPEAAGHQRQTS